METIVLWHGGRDLEYNYRNNQASSKGRWEHGPGLYLTTHYETARQYAKGGGKTYQVQVEKGNSLHEVNINVSLINEFISQHVIKSKQKPLMEQVYENIERMNSSPFIKAEYFFNLVFNLKAITNTNTPKLAQFFVDNNVDYGYVNRFNGRDESLLVIYNKKKIQKVKAIRAKDIELSQYELPFEFIPKTLTLKM